MIYASSADLGPFADFCGHWPPFDDSANTLEVPVVYMAKLEWRPTLPVLPSLLVLFPLRVVRALHWMRSLETSLVFLPPFPITMRLFPVLAGGPNGLEWSVACNADTGLEC